jgi:Big-like domain-containing protein
MRTRSLLALLVVLVSCEEEFGPNISDVPGYLISSVQVIPIIDTIFVSDTIVDTDQKLFIAVATGKNGAALPEMRFVWSTSDPTIATVNEIGIVRPLRVGTVEVTASADKIGTATLVILPKAVPIPETSRGGNSSPPP